MANGPVGQAEHRSWKEKLNRVKKHLTNGKICRSHQNIEIKTFQATNDISLIVTKAKLVERWVYESGI